MVKEVFKWMKYMKNISQKMLNLMKFYPISSTDKLGNTPDELVNQNVKKTTWR